MEADLAPESGAVRSQMFYVLARVGGDARGVQCANAGADDHVGTLAMLALEPRQ